MRYLEEERPGFLRRMFSLLQDGRLIEREMVTELGMEPENFWSEIDDVVVGHFERKGVGV